MKTLEVGSSVSIISSDLKFLDQPITLSKKHLYRCDGDSWFEYEFKHIGKKFYLEICEDLAYVTVSQLSCDDLRVSPSDYIHGRPAQSIEFGGKAFALIEQEEAIFYKNCDPQRSEEFSYYEYNHENQYITVEVWEEDDIEVHVSIGINVNEIR